MKRKRSEFDRREGHHVVARSLPILSVILGGVAGCPPGSVRTTEPPRLLTQDEAIRAVNENARLLQAGLRSNSVEVKAELRVEGRNRRFDLRGNLGYLKPHHFYLLLSHSLVPEPVMRIGSNDEEYWVWVEAEGSKMWVGRRDELSGTAEAELPVHPDHLIESLGLNELPETPGLDGPFLAVQEERNQFVFIRFDRRSRPYVSKEYWLDRRPPFLVCRIVFRHPDGTVGMETRLDDYRKVNGGPMMAHHMRIDWPAQAGYMDLRMSKITVWENLQRSHPYFRPPPDADEIERIGSGL